MEFNKINKDLMEIIVNGEMVGSLIKENKNIIIELNDGTPEYLYSKYTTKIKTWKEAKERAESLYQFNISSAKLLNR